MSAASSAWHPAPAKVNLQLRVRSRRDDGYHDLDGVMARLDLADELALDAAADGGPDVIVRYPTGDPWLDREPLPLGADNLVQRAGAAYRHAAAAVGVRVPPLRWSLRKRIPVAAGLAGGSTDAATALRLVARRYPAEVALTPLAEHLGSDVPFFLQPSPAARARGRGERLDAVRAPTAGVVIVHPGVGVRAADAYRWWAGARDEARTAPGWWDGPELANDLEPGVARHVPEVAALLDLMREVGGAAPVLMTGSGSACVALVEGAAEAGALLRALDERLPQAWWRRAAALASAR